MKNTNFYNSLLYEEKQAILTKANWEKGVYDFLSKREKRQCANPECRKWFIVKPAEPKKFCSRKCAAKVNNPPRSNITPQAKKEIASLYQRGLSMKEVADKTGWSLHQVAYWLDKCNIARRPQSEATYLKWNPNGDPFKIKNKLNRNEILLKGLGLGLYWGEGDKSNNNTSVRLGNTDPQLLKKFREFLVKICGAKKERFGYYLTLFNDYDKEEAIKFWGEHLGIKRKHLGKITKIPPQGKGTYRKKSKFGVLSLVITNKKLKKVIFKMINEI